MKLFPIILFFAFFSVTVFAQLPPEKQAAPAIDDVYLARDDGTGKAGEVVDEFGPGDVPIHCIVTLTNVGPVGVKMNLVAVKVNGVRPETKVVTAGYTTKQGENQVRFRGRPDGVWVAGTYRIDVFLEGKKEKSLTFEVKGNSAPAGAMKFAPKPRNTQASKTN